MRFEDLCERPEESLASLFDHCALAPGAAAITALSGRIKAPTYYKANFSDAELEIIEAETREVAARFGY